MFATVSRVTALSLLLLVSGTAQAQGSGGGTLAKTLPWDKVQQIVQHFEEVSPQPPPLESVLLGTFDAATGDFIWGPSIELWEVPVDLPYDDIAVAPAFELRGIPPLSVDLSPQLSGLSSIGSSAQIALQGQGPGALAKPGGAAGKSKGKGPARLGGNIDTQALPQAGQNQRFRGHPLDNGVMRTFVRAAKIAFVVEVVNRQPEQSVSLSIDGSTVQAAADLIDVIAPPRTRHAFEIRSANRLFADKLFVFRPPLIGTFTLEALPVTIVYEPPGGQGCTQTYTSVHRAGTDVRSFQSNEDSASEPIDTPISTLNEYCEIAKTVGGAASSAPNPYVSGAGTVVSGAASVLQAAFGSLSINQEVSATVTDTHALTLEVTEGSSTATSEGLGPGQGDVFHFLVKPTFAWIVAQDFQSGKVFVSTALLGHAGVARYSARSLREHTMAVPPTEMQDLLLALDPLAPEYGAAALAHKANKFDIGDRFGSSARVVPLAAPMVYLSGASGSFLLEHTLTSSDEHARVEVTTTTTKSSAGFLSYITPAVPKDEDSKMVVRQGSTSTTSTSDTVAVQVDLVVASGADGMVLEVGYDRLFGTFTFKKLEAQPQFMSGSVSDGSGAPLGNEPMLLTFQDGRSMRARTDKQGKFSIRPPLKVAGPILVQSGGARTTVDWKGTAHTGVELRGATAQAATGPKKTKSSGTGFPDPKTVPVTASEGGTTAIAIRGKPVVARVDAVKGIVIVRNRFTGQIKQFRNAALAKELKVGDELESDAGMTHLTGINGKGTQVALTEPDDATPCCGVAALVQDPATMQALLGANPAEPVNKPRFDPAEPVNAPRGKTKGAGPVQANFNSLFDPAESITGIVVVRDNASGALHLVNLSVLDAKTMGSVGAPITSSVELGDPVSIDEAAGLGLFKAQGGTYAFGLLTPAKKAEPTKSGKSPGPVPDPTLKGRLGRLVVKFPEAAKVPSCPIEVYVGETQSASVYGSLAKDLLAGEYTLRIQGRRVEQVEVRAGHVTNVQVGALRLQGAAGTEFQIFEVGSKQAFFNCYGPQDVGLPPGEVEVGIAGQRVKVEIVAGQVTEF